MHIVIKTTNFSLTPAIDSHIRNSLGMLKKIVQSFGDEIETRVEVGRTSFHHKKGDVFFAEVNLMLGKSKLRSCVESTDVYSAIDMVKDELKNEILRFKGKKETMFRRGARSVGKFFRISKSARFK
ncbi:MAG: ribosome-associated translation inhibitor RaiA [Patescibacteria group bacterium]